MACAIDVGLGIVIYIVLFILLSRRAPPFTYVGRVSNVCAGRGVSCASFGHRYVDGPRRFVLQLGELAYLVGVFVLQRGLTGSTLGTRVMGVVTVGHDGRPIGPLRALWRSVAGIVDYLPCCVPIVGIATIFATTGHRRVGDMAARSLVVDRDHLGSPVLVPGLDTGVSAGAAAFGAPPVPPVPSTGPPTRGPPTSYPPTTGNLIATNAPPWETAPTPPTGPTAPGPPSTPDAAPASTPTPGAQPYSPPVPPAPGAPAPGSPSATPPPPADPTQPQWDADRQAYIQWDQIGQRWMQFDQATQEWRPI